MLSQLKAVNILKSQTPFPPASSKRPFDSPNGGHDLPPEKVTAMGPNEVSLKNLAVSFFLLIVPSGV